MRFAHARFEVDDTPAQRGIGIVYRPLVLVHLIGPKGRLRTHGLLDTGADETLITREMADSIGLLPISGASGRILSAGGEVPLVYSPLEFEVSFGESYRWRTVVGVAEQPWDTAILGFRGFLEYFDTAFFGHALEFVIERNTRPFAE